MSRNKSGRAPDRSSRASRFTTETKEATKTTELIAFVLAVVGVAVTAFTVDEDPDFGAERAWLYITILTVGYMITDRTTRSGTTTQSARLRRSE
jgi:hypothetical protein